MKYIFQCLSDVEKVEYITFKYLEIEIMQKFSWKATMQIFITVVYRLPISCQPTNNYLHPFIEPCFMKCLRKTFPGSTGNGIFHLILNSGNIEWRQNFRDLIAPYTSSSPQLVNTRHHIDGLVQDCSISIANTLEKLQSCTKPSIYIPYNQYLIWPANIPLTKLLLCMTKTYICIRYNF